MISFGISEGCLVGSVQRFAYATYSAYTRGSGVAAVLAGSEAFPFFALHVLESLFAALQEAVIEVHLASGHLFFQLDPQAFKGGKAGSLAVRAWSVVVFYAHQECIVGGLEFREAPEWFDLADKAFGVFKGRPLIAEIGRVPAQGIAGESGNFIVEVMPRGQDGEPSFSRRLIEEIALDLAACRTDGTAQQGFYSGNGQTFLRHVPDDEGEAVPGAEAFHHAAGSRRGLRYAQVYMQAGDVVSLPSEFQHEGEGILASGKGHEDAVVTSHELMLAYASVHLTGKEVQEAVRTEGGVMTGQGYDGFGFAAAALHGTSQHGIKEEGKAEKDTFFSSQDLRNTLKKTKCKFVLFLSRPGK